MNRRDGFELYVDYLIASHGQVSMTRLSELLDGSLSHDYLSRSLEQPELDQASYWGEVKPFVRQIENEEAILSFDDTIVHKPYSTENELINYHFDHTKGRSVKGINLLNFVLTSEYQGEELTVPVSWHAIRKTEQYICPKTGKKKRKSALTKNEIMQQILEQILLHNHVKCKYILFDSWFASADNMKFINDTLQKTFICALKKNRSVALSEDDKENGRYSKVSELGMGVKESRKVWLKEVPFPVTLTRQVFKNGDSSENELFLVTNDTTLTADQKTSLYKKRWNVEVFHKSLKQNVALGQSPAKMETSQHNHIFASMLAFCKLEKLKLKERIKHFALKSRLYMNALKASFQQLKEFMKPSEATLL